MRMHAVARRKRISSAQPGGRITLNGFEEIGGSWYLSATETRSKQRKPMLMWKAKMVSAAPTRRNPFLTGGKLAFVQSEASRHALTKTSCCSSSTRTSSSMGSTARSAAYFTLAFSTTAAKPIIAPNCMASARRVTMSERTSHPSRELSSWKAPSRTDGMMSTSTGTEPRSICGSESPMMPVATEVGQSGPPTRIMLLSAVIPGRCSTTRIERITLEFIPHAARIATRWPRRRPMTSCCMAIAMNLRAEERTQAITTPFQKDEGAVEEVDCFSSSLIMFHGIITPAQMYTGTPGMMGMRNMAMPTARKMTSTAARCTGSSRALRPERKTTTPWLTSTCITR
mmetsp:Transcript_19322/g.41131  ORF Transcript_19322/g.41131 Transcript_19322/m.41131 type:complete len:341 (+) Transcript_19322:586-1608(+)